MWHLTLYLLIWLIRITAKLNLWLLLLLLSLVLRILRLSTDSGWARSFMHTGFYHHYKQHFTDPKMRWDLVISTQSHSKDFELCLCTCKALNLAFMLRHVQIKRGCASGGLGRASLMGWEGWEEEVKGLTSLDCVEQASFAIPSSSFGPHGCRFYEAALFPLYLRLLAVCLRQGINAWVNKWNKIHMCARPVYFAGVY